MFTAVIPARSGSRRLKNKNILPFSNSNLLIHKIRQLKNVKEIDNIIVSSDSDEYLDMARSEGVNIHKREKEYSDEISKSFGEVVAKICKDITGDDIIWSTCTSPFVTPELYGEAILKYKENIPLNNDSLVSFEPFKRYIWDEHGPLNYNLGTKHVPSQELKQLYYCTDGILIAPRIKMIEWKYFHGKNPYMFILDKKSSIDIDDEFDYILARCIEKYDRCINM